MLTKTSRIISLLLCFVLLFEQSGFSQIAGQIDLSRYIIGQPRQYVGAAPTDKYRPLHLRYLSYDNQNNSFKLLLDVGDGLVPSRNNVVAELARPDKRIKNETKKLMEYFFIGLSLPNESFWVNLRPDSPDNIIDPELSKTDIGRILLEADVQLKKDTALYTSPQTKEGKEYWDKLYKKAEELYGYQAVDIPTLTRPWIVPGEIIIREANDDGRLKMEDGKRIIPSAYIYKATLKVMLEEDYLKNSNQLPITSNQNIVVADLGRQNNGRASSATTNDPRLKQLNTYSTQLIKELIIPKLTKEINSSKRYANLRQVYYSLILAQWFKQRFDVGARFPRPQIVGAGFPRPQSVGDELVRSVNHNGRGNPAPTGYTHRINSRNLTGLTSQTPWSTHTYYQQYQKSFKDGEYSIKEPIRTPTCQVIRSYFSGGVSFGGELAKSVSSGIIQGRPDINPEQIFSQIAAGSGINNYLISAVLKEGNIEIKASSSAVNSSGEKNKHEGNKKIEELYETAGKLVSCGAFLQAVPYYEQVAELAKETGGAAILYKAHALAFIEIIKKISRSYSSRNIASDNFDQFTPGITYPNRLQATHSYILSLLQTFQANNQEGRPIVVDVGTGYLPVTTKELADALGDLSKVIGVDLFIPSFIVEVMADIDGSVLPASRRLTGLFNEQCQFVYGFGDSRGFITPVDVQLLLAVKENLFEQIKGKINNTPFTLKDEHNNSIIYLPFKQYESANLEFREGGFSLPLETGEKADVIRIFNVMQYYTGQEKAALDKLADRLNDGGFIIAGNVNANMFSGKMEFLTFQKRKGALIPMALGTQVLFPDTSHPEIGGVGIEKLFERYRRTWSEMNERIKDIRYSFPGQLKDQNALVVKLVERLKEEGYSVSLLGGTTLIFPLDEQGEIIHSTVDPADVLASSAINRDGIKYMELLQVILNGPAVTEATLQRQGALAKIGVEVEQYIQQLFNNDKIRIAIVPLGSTLKGYANPQSDIEYTILILDGISSKIFRIGREKKRKILEFVNSLFANAKDKFRNEGLLEMTIEINNIPEIIDDLAVTNNDTYGYDLFYLFLPAVYADEELLEQRRKEAVYAIIRQDNPQDIWGIIQKQFLEALSVRWASDVLNNGYLETWLKQQGVDTDSIISMLREKGITGSWENAEDGKELEMSFPALEEFNKKRAQEIGLFGIRDMLRIYARKHKQVDSQVSASPLTTEKRTEEVGGIDFGAMPIVTQSVNVGAGLVPARNNGRPQGSPLQGTGAAPFTRPDNNWLQIEKMINAGIIPSLERIEEYLASSSLQQDADSVGTDYNLSIIKVLCCIAAVLRIEEERDSPTAQGFKQLLDLVESGQSADELRVGLSNIVVIPEEPKP